MSFVPGYPKYPPPVPFYIIGTGDQYYDANTYSLFQQVDLGNSANLMLTPLDEIPNFSTYRVLASYDGTVVITCQGNDMINNNETLTTTLTISNRQTVTLQKLEFNSTFYYEVVSTDEGIPQQMWDSGSATLNSSGSIVVNSNNVTPSAHITLTVQDGVVPTGSVYISARTVGTSFTIASTGGSSDENVVVAFQIWEDYVY